MGHYGWCLVVLGKYKAFVPVYIEKKVEIWSDVTIAGQQTKRKDRATQPMDHGRLR